jgi:tetrahydromethanopterin S-methyltransferase subunit G
LILILNSKKYIQDFQQKSDTSNLPNISEPVKKNNKKINKKNKKINFVLQESNKYNITELRNVADTLNISISYESNNKKYNYKKIDLYNKIKNRLDEIKSK